MDRQRRGAAAPLVDASGRRHFLRALCAAPLGLASLHGARAAAAVSPASGAAPHDDLAGATGPVLMRQFAGAMVPAVGLGTWQAFDVHRGDAGWDEARATLARFHVLGGTVVDSSPMYGAAEAAVGSLSQAMDINGALYLATKVWTQGAEAGEAQLAASLQLLRRDTLDLVLVHNLVDLDTQMALLRRAQEDGRVRHAGISHYHAGAHAAVLAAMQAHSPDVVQINYSVAEPEAAQRILPMAQERGIGVMVNRPFAEGSLLARLRGRELPGFAAELGARSWAQLLLKWILAEPAVSVVLTGTRNPAHIEENLLAATGGLPDAAQRKAIAAAVAAA